MGAFSSKSKKAKSRYAAPTEHKCCAGAQPAAGVLGGFAAFHSPTMKFRAIADRYTSVDQVQEALRSGGLESSNLIVAVDFTKSNEWTGKHSFRGKSLHAIGDVPSPYEEAISVIGRTLSAFDDDGLIPCYGFGDTTTGDSAVFSFLPRDQPCQGLEQVVSRYRELCPHVRMAGPTSFAPAIRQASRIVEASGGQYHILLLVADGQVTRPSGMPKGSHSDQERDTIDAIVEASHLPLSIVMVGVGDGPWDLMNDFDDELPQRNFDNFQFVNFTQLAASTVGDTARREATFALRALMEIPEQFAAIQRLGLLGSAAVTAAQARSRSSAARRGRPPMDPPVPVGLTSGSACAAAACGSNPRSSGVGTADAASGCGAASAAGVGGGGKAGASGAGACGSNTRSSGVGAAAASGCGAASGSGGGGYGKAGTSTGASGSNAGAGSGVSGGKGGAGPSTTSAARSSGSFVSTEKGAAEKAAAAAGSGYGSCGAAGVRSSNAGGSPSAAAASSSCATGSASGSGSGKAGAAVPLLAAAAGRSSGAGVGSGAASGSGAAASGGGGGGGDSSCDGDSGALPSLPDPMFLCPITQDVMTDPVIATDGYTYERDAITQWLASRSTSPMTNQPMPGGGTLIPNHGLRSAIMEWRQRTGQPEQQQHA